MCFCYDVRRQVGDGDWCLCKQSTAYVLRISDCSSDVCSSDLVWLAVLIAWGIAFFEYCLVIPANRIGYGVYSAGELKTLQEVVTLIIFAGFAVFWLGEKLTVNHLVGFGLIAIGRASCR